MSTTTIRQPEELEARIAAAAKRAGTTAHGFILEAIAEKAELEERRADFNRVAGERFTRQPRAIIASAKASGEIDKMAVKWLGRPAGELPN